MKKSTILTLFLLPILAVGINSCSQDPREKAVNILKDKGIKRIDYERELVYSCSRGDIETVHLLLLAGTYVNTGESTNTPLVAAADGGHIQIVRLLLSVRGINVNKTNDCGRTPLSEAATRGHTEIVKMLLAVPGIDVNKADADAYKWTPLCWAAERGHTEIVKLLLAVPGIDVNKGRGYNIWHNPRPHWNTPLSVAVYRGHTEIVKLLLAVPGIDVNKYDVNHESPLDCAERGNHTKIIKLLKAAGAK